MAHQCVITIHAHKGLHVSIHFYLLSSWNFAFFFYQLLSKWLFGRKIWQNSLTWLAVLLAPGRWALGYVEPWHSNKMSIDFFFNTLRLRQHGRHFADDTFKRIFLNENVIISIKISLTFIPKGPINNIPALVQIMAWRRPGDKPLSEAMMVSLLTHICVTRPQWVNPSGTGTETRTFWANYQ